MTACSAERKNIISKTYHNTTARYNAYFYAKENITQVENILEESYDNNYNKVLRIYPEIDSSLAQSYQEQIEEAIKKASIAIQRHKNSKWVDDSYILIGLARYYSLDFVNAIETFKYVNTKSEDDHARHRALVQLLRTFTDYSEFSNAVAVSDYLKKEKLNKTNLKDLHINRAYYYQIQNDHNLMVQNLVKAAPLLKKKDGKGRIYFIIGQVYQMLGFESEAYSYYKKCIASNPEYELDFYARLYMAQVTQLNKSGDLKAARKLFQKLLKDRKNKEFRDKIYYEMASFELRHGNLDESINHFKSSVRASTSNNRQKGQSYLKLGEIHYDSLRKYQLAKNYYDSTIAVLPTDFENYEQIKQRQQILAEFVQHLNTIQLQDSLLALANEDSITIRNRIEAHLQAEAEKKKAEEIKQKRQERRDNFISSTESTGFGGTSWYFDNPSAVALGQTEFRRIWGDRPLEDNWRISSIGANSEFESPEEITDTGIEVSIPENSSAEDSHEMQVAALYNQIPFTPEARSHALREIENAYYQLGNIYYFNLQENKNAAEAFETLLERFPETENEPEVLYQLYLIYKGLALNPDKYKNILLSKYPNTTYAKLIVNPAYTEESTAANEQLKKAYKQAYDSYQEGNYQLATEILNEALQAHQETVFSPRLKLLKIMIVGKTEDINLYQYQLGEFIKAHPDSEITPYAEKLLEASRNFLKKQQRLLGTEFLKYYDQEHYFVVLYDAGKGLADIVYPQIRAFNEESFSSSGVRESNLIFDKNHSMTMVSGLQGKKDAEGYYKKFLQADVISEKTQNSKFYKFVITKDNFNILYESKDLEAYLRFFDKYYRNEF